MNTVVSQKNQAEKKEGLAGKNNLNNLNNHGDNLVNNVKGAVEGADVRFEIGMNLPSETISEDRQKAGDGSAPAQNDDQQQADQIRATIQKDPQKMTRKAVTYFVKIAVHKEISTVQKEVHDLSQDVVGNAFELSEALKKLKKLKLIMKNLAHWTVDFLRSMLQRVQKGEKLFDVPLPQE